LVQDLSAAAVIVVGVWGVGEGYRRCKTLFYRPEEDKEVVEALGVIGWFV
jgi:hypothetical protein